MPPKQLGTRATKVHSDSTYEDSGPEPQPISKPRITLKRGKSLLNLNETNMPIHSRTVARQNSQDQIYRDLLSRPANNEPATKKQRVSTPSVSSAAVVGKRYFALTYKHLFQLNVC